MVLTIYLFYAKIRSLNYLFMATPQDKNKGEGKATPKAITTRAKDYSEWYLDVIDAAGLAEHSPVKGCMVIKPYGYALWERTQKILNEKFKQTGVENAYFPLFIPEKFLKKEAEHVEGFAPEVAVVTHAGGKKLDEPLVIRPTSETIMYDVFSRWIHSYRDLPLLINQWANVVRWEKRTRLFLRTTEFLWQEGHTVHETEDEADRRARQMVEVYRDFAENYMAISVLTGAKTDSEKFAGALRTYTLEAMMQDGKALQFATSHNLGQNFAKAFNIKYLDRNNENVFAWQTSWGLSTRTIGALIMVHGDDRGLVIPPKMASIHAVIIPILGKAETDELVNREAEALYERLGIETGLSFKLDRRDNLRPGEKFYEWEKKGVPIRIELGPKDIQAEKAVLVRRDTGEKISAPLKDLGKKVIELLDEIQKNLFEQSKARRAERTKTVDSWADFVTAIETGNFVLAHFSGEAEVEDKIKKETGATVRCIPFDSKPEEGKCILSGKPSKQRVVFAKSY